MAAATLDTIGRLRFQMLPHSPDHSPSNYHAWTPEGCFEIRIVNNDVDVKETEHFFSLGIHIFYGGIRSF